MNIRKFLAIAAATIALATTPATASDHFDGPAVLNDPTTDITDMYVFPSPEKADRLVLVMNVIPNAGTKRWFSHMLDYRFRIHPVSISGTGDQAGFSVGKQEISFRCVFSDLKTSSSGEKQTGHCHSPSGELHFTVGRRTSEAEFQKTGLKVFAGLRLDPFFMDVAGYVRSMKEGRLNFMGKNTAQGLNVLSVIVEVDRERFLPKSDGMYGVISEIRSRGEKSVVLDTFGRPEITNVILADPGYDKVNSTIDVRDIFNRRDPFGEPGAYAEPLEARFNANLHRMDTMDGQQDWPTKDGIHPLTALHMADFTVIDLSKPVGTGSWFEIEKAIVEGREHKTGGGRWLDDDICDIQYTFLMARDREEIGDGVDQPTKPASRTFPYLREPEVSG